LFGDLSSADFNNAALMIQAEQALSGFFGYDTVADNLRYPLLDMDATQTEVVLPHVASDDTWWTGVTLFNPSDASIDLEILPYDTNGKLVQGAVAMRTLAPWTKEVFAVSDMFGALASSLTFLKISTPSSEGFIGVYGIGNSNLTMLSGDVLR
jgi:hypothetical protein